jgi:hypothetical protein
MVTCSNSNAYLPFPKSYVDSWSEPIGSTISDATLGMDAMPPMQPRELVVEGDQQLMEEVVPS